MGETSQTPDFCEFEDCTVDASWLAESGQTFCAYHAADAILSSMDPAERSALVVATHGYREPPSPAWKLSPSRKRLGWLVVIGPYDEDFVKAIKLAVAPRCRSWDPVLKAWSVVAEAGADVERIIRRLS